MKAITEINSHLNQQEIANLAKQIWEREGRQAGRDLDYWLRAERQVLLNRNPGNDLPRKPLATGAIRLPDSINKLVQTK